MYLIYCFYVALTEQYRTTKSSWLADYCKEEEQAAQAPPAMPWMGSSVDPPSLGQSESLHSPSLHQHLQTQLHLMHIITHAQGSCHVFSNYVARCCHFVVS